MDSVAGSIEHERKFLVTNPAWRVEAGGGERLWQGWLLIQDGISVRLRISGKGATATCKIAIPGEVDKRVELESQLDQQMADRMRESCEVWLEKTRWTVRRGQTLWEIDEYEGELDGLVTAEVENPPEDLEIPAWAGEELTGRPEWSNQELARTRVSRGSDPYYRK